MIDWYRALRYRSPIARPRVTARTLLLWGERDRALERGLGGASLRLCRDGRGVYFPHATHWLHLEIPEEVNAAIMEFLR
jgi:pimeloyl-ACP methyl ester carboxylesterase